MIEFRPFCGGQGTGRSPAGLDPLGTQGPASLPPGICTGNASTVLIRLPLRRLGNGLDLLLDETAVV